MKKIFALALMLLLLCLPAFARETRVNDLAGRLTYAEISELEEMIAGIRADYALDVGIVTTNDSLGKGDKRYAADYYEQMGYGEDGVLAALCFDTGDFCIVTHGYGIHAFTDSGLDEIIADMEDAFGSEKDYAAGLRVFLKAVPVFMDQAASGAPFDVDNAFHPIGLWERAGEIGAVALILGAVAALIAVLIFRGRMKTAKYRSGAREYLREGSMDLTVQGDWFLYQTVTRRKIETDSGKSGGSTTFKSSSGGSFGGRSGKL